MKVFNAKYSQTTVFVVFFLLGYYVPYCFVCVCVCVCVCVSQVENTIRWRQAQNELGEEVKESNARVVRWSDGRCVASGGKGCFSCPFLCLASAVMVLFLTICLALISACHCILEARYLTYTVKLCKGNTATCLSGRVCHSTCYRIQIYMSRSKSSWFCGIST